MSRFFKITTILGTKHVNPDCVAYIDNHAHGSRLVMTDGTVLLSGISVNDITKILGGDKVFDKNIVHVKKDVVEKTPVKKGNKK